MIPPRSLKAAAAAGVMVAAAFFPGPVFAQARTDTTVAMPADPRARAAHERYGYASAVIAGDMVYLSGIVVGQAPGETEAAAGFDRAFRQIDAILKSVGAGLADVVDMTSYHTDVVAQIEAMSASSKRHLGSPPPAWTAIDVDRLLPDGGIAEIKVVAYRPGAKKAD